MNQYNNVVNNTKSLNKLREEYAKHNVNIPQGGDQS